MVQPADYDTTSRNGSWVQRQASLPGYKPKRDSESSLGDGNIDETRDVDTGSHHRSLSNALSWSGQHTKPRSGPRPCFYCNVTRCKQHATSACLELSIHLPFALKRMTAAILNHLRLYPKVLYPESGRNLANHPLSVNIRISETVLDKRESCYPRRILEM